jgi:hypothetical protein
LAPAARDLRARFFLFLLRADIDHDSAESGRRNIKKVSFYQDLDGQKTPIGRRLLALPTDAEAEASRAEANTSRQSRRVSDPVAGPRAGRGPGD